MHIFHRQVYVKAKKVLSRPPVCIGLYTPMVDNDHVCRNRDFLNRELLIQAFIYAVVVYKKALLNGTEVHEIPVEDNDDDKGA